MSVLERAAQLARSALLREGEPAAERIVAEARLSELSQLATRALGEVASGADAAIGAAAQQRALTETIADNLRLVAERSKEAIHATERLREHLGRIRLVALNSALDGARQSDALGRALLAVAEELRSSAARALEVTEEQREGLAALEAERVQLLDQVRELRERQSTLASELTRAQAALREGKEALGALERGLTEQSGTDPEQAKLVMAAAEHARALARAVAALGAGRARRELGKLVAPLLGDVLRSLDPRRGGDPP